MIEHNKNFYSLEELKRTRDSLEGYLDNEEVYYFVGAIRYACDEIERLNKIIEIKNNIINKLEEFIEKEIELYTIELTEENTNKLSIVAPIRGVYKEIYNVLQELKGVDKDSQDECEDFDKIVYSDDLEKYRQVNGFLNDKGNKIFCQRVHNYLDKKGSDK